MWVEETTNGKFKFVEQYTDYMTGKKKRVYVTLPKITAKTKRLALEELNRKIESAQTAVSKDDLTLKQLVEKYRIYQDKTVKASTYSRNYHACNAIMRILGEDILLNRLTAAFIKERFIDSGKENGTLNEHRARLKALINWGYENEYINDISFMVRFKPFQDIPHREKIQDKFLESSEVKLLLLEMNNWRWRYFTEFLILTGLRFGEAAALKVDDVDVKNSTIHITKNYDSLNKVETTPKTSSSIRDVYIQPELLPLARKISAYMKEQRLLYGYGNAECLYFQSKAGGHINYYAYEKYLHETSAKAIGRRITAHTLRHTHVSLMFENGASIDAIARRLGHISSNITREIYLHVTKKLQEKENEQISKIKIL